MPISFKTKPEYNLIIQTHIGRIPDDEFLSFYKDLYCDDSFDRSINQLVDLRETDSSPRSSEVLGEFAEFIGAALVGVTTRPKVAVVAPKDLSFGLARMYEALTDTVPWDFMVFRTIDTALAWLGLPEDLVEVSDQDA